MRRGIDSPCENPDFNAIFSEEPLMIKNINDEPFLLPPGFCYPNSPRIDSSFIDDEFFINEISTGKDLFAIIDSIKDE